MITSLLCHGKYPSPPAAFSTLIPLPLPPPRGEDDLEADLVEYAHRGTQVVEALEAGDGQVRRGVELLVQAPAAHLAALDGVEDLDIAIGIQVHAKADRLASLERLRKVLAAPAVVDVLAAVVAVHGETASVPAREPEGRVRRGAEADGETDLVSALLEDVDLVVD